MVKNFKNLYLKLYDGTQLYELQGLLDPAIEVTIPSKMVNLLNKSSSISIIHLCSISITTETSTTPLLQIAKDHEDELTTHLSHYADVFAEPRSLPPQRHLDHRIDLKQGTNPIVVRAYRYLTVQNMAIENMISEMLHHKIIQTNNSAFLAPVVLVKKKDNMWRLCIDYRKLNEASIKNKLLIPFIEELLDELHDAIVFSKSDLRSGYHQIHMKDTNIKRHFARSTTITNFWLCRSALQTLQQRFNSSWIRYSSHFSAILCLYLLMIYLYKASTMQSTWITFGLSCRHFGITFFLLSA